MDRRRHTRIVAAACKWRHSAVWCQRAGGVGGDWDYSRSRESSSYVDDLLCHTEVWPLSEHPVSMALVYWRSLLNLQYDLKFTIETDVLKGVYCSKHLQVNSQESSHFSFLKWGRNWSSCLRPVIDHLKYAKMGEKELGDINLFSWRELSTEIYTERVLPSSSLTQCCVFPFVLVFSLQFYILS